MATVVGRTLLPTLLLAALLSDGAKGEGEGDATPWSFAIDAPDWHEPDWSELDRLGFLVVRGWVRKDVAEWSRQLGDNWLKNGLTSEPLPYSWAPHSPATASTEAAVERLLRAIRASPRTALRPDTIVHFNRNAPRGSPAWRPNCTSGLSYYFHNGQPPNGVRPQPRFSFHTDMLTAWGRFMPPRGGSDLLNFYMPVLKPRREDANLLVLPWPSVPEAEQRWLRGRLGRIYIPQKNDSSRLLEKHDSSCKRGWDALAPTGRSLSSWVLKKRSVSPALAAGDLLVLLGDTLHASGPGDPERFRLALSIRASSLAFELGAERGRRRRAICLKGTGRPFPAITCKQGGRAFTVDTSYADDADLTLDDYAR